jgi:copper transporter 1
MLFTWDTTNLCIIFRWWHIQTNAGLIFSLLGVVALTAGYEAIRSLSRQYEALVAKRQEEAPSKLALHTTSALYRYMNLIFAIPSFSS